MHFSQIILYFKVLWLKNYFIDVSHFSSVHTCIFMHFLQQYNQYLKFKSSIVVYPMDVNPIEVYPIEAYLIGRGAVKISGCSRFQH